MFNRWQSVVTFAVSMIASVALCIAIHPGPLLAIFIGGVSGFIASAVCIAAGWWKDDLDA